MVEVDPINKQLIHKLSVIITTYNEEDTIVQCLESIKWADEIIIVDSYSSDRTLILSEPYKPTIINHSYKYAAHQKNKHIPQASHDWVFLLDADEVCTDSLRDEIKNTLIQPLYDMYWIPRHNFFMGQKIKYSGWQSDKVIRLFHKDKARYEDKRVHEEIITQGYNVGKLKSSIKHYTFKNLPHFIAKINRYAEYKAMDLFEKKVKPNFYHFHIKPAFRFFRQYFLRGGFLDGNVGYIICRLSAYEQFLRYAKLYEKYLSK